MKILFVHQNFPGQFLHLAPALAALGHDVSALTADSNMRVSPTPTHRYSTGDRSFTASEYGLSAHFAEQTYRGERVAIAAARLRSAGYIPDAIIGHVGWGETLYLGDIWPSARRSVYAEFFYRSVGLDVDFDPEFHKPNVRRAMWVRSRQAPQLIALTDAHQAISPTRWQASTYPPFLRDRIEVIHDGIQTDVVQPDPDASIVVPGLADPVRSGDEILTFVNRNLEPHRGYHIFMRALPAILRARPNARAIIVGADGASYGARPKDGRSWKEVFLAEVRESLDLSHVHFVGRVPYKSFVQLMQVTRVHAYLTYPFVLSWSLLEAMSAGALIVASRTAPVTEVVEDGVNGRLVDFFDIDGWVHAIVEALAEPEKHRGLRAEARRRVVEYYDLRSRCLPRQIEFIERCLG